MNAELLDKANVLAIITIILKKYYHFITMRLHLTTVNFIGSFVSFQPNDPSHIILKPRDIRSPGGQERKQKMTSTVSRQKVWMDLHKHLNFL